mgnify:FL=1
MRIILLLLLIFFSQTSSSRNVVNIATGSFPPYTGSGLKEGGYVLQLVTAAFKATGYKVKYHYLPWQRGYKDSSEGLYDATAFYVCTDERKKLFFCSLSAVSKDRFIFFRKASAEKPKWSELSDLRNVSIGLTLGYFYDKDFYELSKVKERNITLSPVKTDIQNMKKLASGKIDLFPLDKNVGLFLLRERLSKAERIKIAYDDQVIFNQTAHILFPKKSKNSSMYRNAFDRGMNIISNNGIKDKIISDSLIEDFD